MPRHFINGDSCPESRAAPRISLVIAIRDESIVPCVRIDPRREGCNGVDIETLLVYGNNPSHQRNLAARAATGELLYFLDDDSSPEVGVLGGIMARFDQNRELTGVGGPAIARDDATTFERATWLAMGSYFGQARMAQRFRSTGAYRDASEEHLIACNLAVRRTAWLKLSSGFDARLHPNEENELINRLKQRGASFKFDPKLVVQRRFAANPLAVIRRFYRYGRSRITHFKVAPQFFRIAPLVPAWWVCYLAVLASYYLQAGPYRSEVLPSKLSALLLWPLAVYSLAAILSAVLAARRAPSQRLRHAASVLVVFLLMHIAYGIGAWIGVFTPVRHRGSVRSLRRLPVPTPMRREMQELTIA